MSLFNRGTEAVVDIDHDAAERLCTTPEMEAFVVGKAFEVARHARDLTPGEDEREAIVAGGYSEEGGAATSAVASRSPIWHIIEFGSQNNRPYRPLTSAVERAGLRYDPR